MQPFKKKLCTQMQQEKKLFFSFCANFLEDFFFLRKKMNYALTYDLLKAKVKLSNKIKT